MISIFKNIASEGVEMPLLTFLENVKNGFWRNLITPIRLEQSKEKRTELKKGLPLVTISGTFNKRKASEIIKHSGFICIDIDDNIEAKELLKKDPYIVALFVSVSGNGLGAIVKINENKHLETFLSLEGYFFDNYGIIIDRACKDVSRARFVSYDPDLYFNLEAKKYTHFLVEKKPNPKKLPQLVTSENDLEFITRQISQSGVNLTGDNYQTWLELGFSIAAEHGENGRDLFHLISYNSSKYNSKNCDKQYSHCLKSKGHGITYATFMFHCKNAGLQLVSEETKRVTAISLMTKKAGRGLHDAIKVLKEVEKIEGVEKLVQKVFDSNIDTNPLSKLESLEIFISNNYNFKRNEITRFIEENGKEIDTPFLNSVYIKARKEVDDKVKFEEIDRLIGSDFTENYNPIIEFIEKNKSVATDNELEKLANVIETNTGIGTNLKELMVKKWFVGVISSVFGKPSPLILVLTGGQNSGKTTFFRNLLPTELQDYYAESRLDAGKDDEILMTQKLIIMDDEFGGKNKTESKHLKELSSKEFFTLREPYGRKNVSLKRLAILCGTSNDKQIINDPTGNRRIIPFDVLRLNHLLYNSINKTALLIDAYNLYQTGFTFDTNKEEIELLNQNTSIFEQVRPERELILKYFKLPETGERTEFMQAMEIKAYLEKMTMQRLILPKIVFELQELNFMQIRDGQKVGYQLVRCESTFDSLGDMGYKQSPF